jgi:chaperone modulatory protein CbpM
MMFDATELCRQLGIQRTALEAWIEAGWLRPVRARNDWRFSTIDLMRAQFILDLRDPMGVNDEGVSVILGLLDQIHGLRRALLGVTSTMGVQKASPRARQPADTGSSIRNPPQRPGRRGHAAA